MTGASQQTFNRETRHEIAPKTGGELVMRLLQAKGVDFVFGTTDGAMNDIQDAMVVVKPPKWIQGLHEFVSVNAASGYGLASGKAGVAMIGRIVGTLNAAGAGYCAYALSSPIVIIGSTNAPGAPIPNQLPEYHYFGDQFQPISMFLKWKTISSSLETLPDDIDKAFFLATSEHPGITYVAVRQDLMASRPGSSRVTNKESPAVSPIITDLETTEEVVSFLLKSDQPEVVTSKIGRRPQAVASLVSFAHTFGAAVREERSFMNYPVSDPFYLDALDVFGGYRPPELLKETDLLFSIEFGLIPQYTFEEGVSVVEMTSDPLFNHDVPMGGGDYGSTPVRALKRLVCDSGPMLDALVKLGEKRMTPDDRKEVEKRTEKISEMHEKALREWRTKGEEHYRKGLLDGWSIGHALNAHWTPSTVWVNGAITFASGLNHAIELERPGTFFGNPSEHLGAVTGMAYGVALADRKYTGVQDKGGYKAGSMSRSSRTVVCTTGDGDAIFGNINSALWTCKHYGIGVFYMILNNACWGIEWPPIEKSPQHWAKKAKDYEFLDLDHPRLDFTAIAKSVGVASSRVEDTEGLDAAIKQGMGSAKKGNPFLVDVWAPKHTGPTRSVVP